MKIIHSLPPNIDDIIKVFPFVKNRNSVVFTYGNILYSPSDSPIPDHLMVHEETHERQQGNSPKQWWDLYLSNPTFRLHQELQAYRNQYDCFCSTHKDRNARNLMLHDLALMASSPMYGKMISYLQARKEING